MDLKDKAKACLEQLSSTPEGAAAVAAAEAELGADRVLLGVGMLLLLQKAESLGLTTFNRLWQ